MESYPTRQLRLDDKTWEKLKDMKLKSGLTWNKFIGDIIKKKSAL